MSIYNQKFLLTKVIILLYFFLTIQSFSQESEFETTGTPKNIIPDVELEDTDNETNNYSDKVIDTVDNIAITELPKISAGWTGILSEEDGSLGWDMWNGTDANFAKILIELLPVNAPSAAMRSLAKRLLLSRAARPLVSSTKELSIIGPDGKPIELENEEATFLSLRFSKLARLGAGKELLKLSETVHPADMVDTLAKEAISARLLSGETKQVCSEVINLAPKISINIQI